MLRISAIMDGCFSLIVDGETVLPKRRWASPALAPQISSQMSLSEGIALTHGLEQPIAVPHQLMAGRWITGPVEIAAKACGQAYCIAEA